MDSMLQLILKLNQELEEWKERVDTIEEEFSSKLEDNEKAC